MRKLLLTMMVLAFTWKAGAQKPAQVIIPGKAKIDVELLKNKLPLDIHVDDLSLAETRILRNAPADRQGYCFMNADLRGIFSATSWYTEIMEDRFWKEEGGKAKPIKYSAAEMAFINKLKAHEEKLKAQNHTVPAGMLVNMDNLVNPFQLQDFDPQIYQAIGKNGFVIVPGKEDQLFHVYERNDYRQFPSFVTTDLFLQAFHMFFDCLLKETEQQKLAPMVTTFVKTNYDLMMQKAATTSDPIVKEAAEHNATYFAIAYALNTGKQLPVPATYQQMMSEEISHVKAAKSSYSTFLGYTLEQAMPKFIYNIYRPRGHYTRNDQLKRYFQAMMWLQNVPFGTDKKEQLRYALLMAETIGSNEALTKQYKNLTEPITYLMGTPDDISILQVYDEIRKSGYTLQQLYSDQQKMSQIRKALEDLSKRQSRIKPKFQRSSNYKICLMPQRYMPDGEVLQEMVDYDSEITLRDVPKGLDVLAALGAPGAERILLGELTEQGRRDDSTETPNAMKKRMGAIDWRQTAANPWMAAPTAVYG